MHGAQAADLSMALFALSGNAVAVFLMNCHLSITMSLTRYSFSPKKAFNTSPPTSKLPKSPPLNPMRQPLPQTEGSSDSTKAKVH